MISQVKEFLEEIKQSTEFKKFREKCPHAFISSISLIDGNLQIDFYDLEMDRITSFTKKYEEIESQESIVFRKDKKEMQELKVEDIKKDLEEVEKIIESKYKDSVTKKIIILQQTDFPVWNITYLTATLNIINVKINGISGEIVEDNVSSASDLYTI